MHATWRALCMSSHSVLLILLKKRPSVAQLSTNCTATCVHFEYTHFSTPSNVSRYVVFSYGFHWSFPCICCLCYYLIFSYVVEFQFILLCLILVKLVSVYSFLFPVRWVHFSVFTSCGVLFTFCLLSSFPSVAFTSCVCLSLHFFPLFSSLLAFILS